MKLDDKRKVIEVLLCSVVPVSRMTTWETCRLLGVPDRLLVAISAARSWRDASRGCKGYLGTLGDVSHGDVCLEAAYRLIESSPTLRAEWFGAA